jgi:hypothetical protein
VCAWQQLYGVTVSCCCQRICNAAVGAAAWVMLLLLLLAHPSGSWVGWLHLQYIQILSSTEAVLMMLRQCRRLDCVAVWVTAAVQMWLCSSSSSSSSRQFDLT